jgi:hypothetical protein
MYRLGDNFAHIHGHVLRDLRHPVKDVSKPLAIHKVFHIQRGEHGQMLALFLSVVIQQAAHRGRILFPGFITIDQHMPLDTHPAGEFNQRLKPDWANSIL